MAGVPSLRRHKASGQGVVTLSGDDFYLGRWPDGQRRPPAAVQAEYDRLVAEWTANGRRRLRAGPGGLTVGELLLRFWAWAETRYDPRGELACLRKALAPVAKHYAATPASAFGPLALKAVRELMVTAGLARKEINRRAGRITRVFRWGVAEELIPEPVWRGLTAVVGLKAGERGDLRETAPVAPADPAGVEAALPHMTREVAAMVRFQRLTGCRPGEACSLLASELERAGPIWVVRKRSHKTAHRGKARCIAVGPRAQAVLLPFLRARCPLCCLEGRAGRLGWRGSLCGPCADRQDEQGVHGPWPAAPVGGDYPVFSPREGERDRQAARAAKRKTPLYPSQARHNARKRRPRRPPGERYSTQSYGDAVRRACKKAGVEPWSPNQLRHLAGTEARRAFGLEAAQVLLGHSRADVTQVYATRDEALALRVAAELG